MEECGLHDGSLVRKHFTRIIIYLSTEKQEGLRSGRFYAVMMMSPERGLA